MPASQITRLTAFGDVATAEQASLTPELQALRRAVERDRYGLMAYVLVARDHCTPAACAAFRSLTDSHQIAANMDERVYEGLVMRYARVLERAGAAPLARRADRGAAAVAADRASRPMPTSRPRPRPRRSTS